MENKMSRAPGISADTELDLLCVKLNASMRGLHGHILAKRQQYAYAPMPADERRELLRLQTTLGQFGQELKALRGTIAQKGYATVENKLFPGQPGASSARRLTSPPRQRRALSTQELLDIKRANELALFTADVDRKLAYIAARRQSRGY